MELKEFIKKVIADTVEAVDESSRSASRDIALSSKSDKRTIEFDVAVSVEETNKAQGEAGIKVLTFMSAGANAATESKNSSITRITFGVDVGMRTKTEVAAQKASLAVRRNIRESFE